MAIQKKKPIKKEVEQEPIAKVIEKSLQEDQDSLKGIPNRCVVIACKNTIAPGQTYVCVSHQRTN